MSTTFDQETRRTGVTLLSRVPFDRAVFVEVARRDAERQNAVFREGDDPVIAMIGFNLGDEMSAVTLIAETRSAISERPDLEVLLGGEAQTVVRIEMTIVPDTRIAPLLADAEVVALIVRLAARLPLIACDDIGAVYDLDELRTLAGRRVGRTESTAFVIEAARRAEQFAELNEVSPRPETMVPVRRLLPLVGTRVPALAWVEALLSESVGIIAPSLDPADQRALNRADVPYSLTFDEISTQPGAVVDARRRDELDVFCGRRLSRQDAVAVLEDIALSFAQTVSETDSEDAPSLTTISAHENEPGAVAKIATFGFRAATVNVYHLDLPDATATLAEALGSRRDIAALIGGTIRSIVAIELVGDDTAAATVDLRRADIFSVSIAAAFGERFDTFAADLGGATYAPADVTRLSAQRRGRDGSWNAQVAAAATTS